MKIAIPTKSKKGLEATVAKHFGRARDILIYDTETKIFNIYPNSKLALILCKELGIEVDVDQAKTVREIFEMWKNNKIKKANFEDVCEEHRI